MEIDSNQPLVIDSSAILALETSVPTASVALWVDGDIVYQSDFTSDRNHNSMVFEPLGEALEVLGERKLSCVLVGTGPGSYSGTRTGIAVGQGVAITQGCPAVGIGSLAATPPARDTVQAVAVGDARRGLYFISEMMASGEAGVAELMSEEEFQFQLSDRCDDRERVLFSLDDPRGPWLSGMQLPSPVVHTSPRATAIIDVWLGMAKERQLELMDHPLVPSYLRPPFTSKAKSGHPLLREALRLP